MSRRPAISLRQLVLASELRSLPVFGKCLHASRRCRVWQDVRAARLKQFRYIVYFIVLADRVEVLAVLDGARDSSSWKSRG